MSRSPSAEDFGYEPDRRSPRWARTTVRSILKSESGLWREMRFPRTPAVLFVKSPEEWVSVYMSGTGSDPVIGIDIGKHLDDGELLLDGLASSIVHELIHAYLESLGLDTCLHGERFVEGMTRDYCDALLSPKEVCAKARKYASRHMPKEG